MIDAADGPLLLAFLAVVRRGSFAAAAAELRLSKSVVSERVKALEARAGARLLERTTRRLQLTEAGTEVLTTATLVDDALRGLSRRLDETRSEPSGTLRVSTTADLGPLLVGPVAARLVAAHPQARVEILSEDARRDVIAARIDVAVRMGTPSPASWWAKRLAVLDEPIVAAPSLAARLGAVGRPRDLAKAPWVRHSIVHADTLRFSRPGGGREEITPAFRAEGDTGGTVLSLLLAGGGVGVLPEHALREHLVAGRLVRLCAPWIWKRVVLFALTPSRPVRPLVRTFLAMLEREIALDAFRFRAPV